MKEYLKAQAWILIDPDTRIKVVSLVVGIVGPAFTAFMLEPSVGTTLILWALDFVLGTYRAWCAKVWRPYRAFFSGLKLAMYLGLLGLGCLLRWGLGGYVGVGVFAAFTSAILLTEATSVLSHAADLCPAEAGPIKGLLQRLASISANADKKSDNPYWRRNTISAPFISLGTILPSP